MAKDGLGGPELAWDAKDVDEGIRFGLGPGAGGAALVLPMSPDDVRRKPFSPVEVADEVDGFRSSLLVGSSGSFMGCLTALPVAMHVIDSTSRLMGS